MEIMPLTYLDNCITLYLLGIILSSCMLSFYRHGLNYSMEGMHVVYLSLLDSTLSVTFNMIAVFEI